METQTSAQIAAHPAFCAGWPNAVPALPIAIDVFERRLK